MFLRQLGGKMESSVGSVIGVAAMVLCSALAYAATPPADATSLVSPAIEAEYVHPHRRVDIGNGRRLNLFCMGNGTQTVVFESGSGDWSSIWALVQPRVAAHARACSYDRAGMGYSDSSGDARSPMAIVDDLRKLIMAAELATPVVLVGHSSGGFDVKLYAALHPEDVAGLVLVDPAEERIFIRTRQLVRAKYGTAISATVELVSLNGVSGRESHYKDCAAAALSHDLDPKSDLNKQCTDPGYPQLGPKIAAERQRIQAQHPYQEAQASEFANGVYEDQRTDDAYASLFSGNALGAKPLIVLTHSIRDRKDPFDEAGFFAWNAVHEQTAKLSTRGVNRIVPETHHYIQIDCPQAVVDAIDVVLREVAAK